MERLLTALNCALAALFMLAVFTPASTLAGTFGRTDIGTLPSAGLSADFKRGSKFTLQEEAAVQQLCAYLDGNGGASGEQRIRYALYRDTSGKPSARVVVGDEILIRSGYPGGWFCTGIPDTELTTGQYWIVLHTGGVAGVIRDYADGPADWYGNADAYADNASDPFGPGSAGNGTLSAFASYVSPQQVTKAGRTTIGTKTSGGMSADFKRASSFTITARGRLSSMSAYLDGQGGTVGSQQASYVLYRDANGVPGTRVLQGQVMAPTNAAPAWYTDGTVPPEILEPGKYWFAIHTGGVAGVLRNYADGTGNWYGNSDTFSDGPSSPFGAGNPGNGTLSAYITYDSRPLRTGQLGRTDIATKPSAGLKANAMRGSVFVYNNSGAVLNELSAYLDGLGGAAGSQKIRMAVYELYDRSANQYDFWYRIAESQEVSIAAGTPPGWVRFPVVATSLGAGPVPVFYITIESGDTGGVVRDYGDGDANWLSVPIAFSQHAPSFFYDDPTVTHGNVTLSVYGTFTEPTSP